ncbi:MAG: DNA replication/repair protein RecF [Candidatus Levyibacteriota bacterium]
MIENCELKIENYMYLKQLSLQNFRSYAKAHYTFDPQLTVVVGLNASGKTNLVEAIGILSTGKSFRTGKELQMVAFEKQVARIEGVIYPSLRATEERGNLTEEGIASSQVPRNDANLEDEKIEITFALSQTGFLQKRYLINGVSKRRSSLTGLLPTVLFTPLDLDIVSGQPGSKRRFLDEILEQTDQDYAKALITYQKALRQRNALLEVVQATGRRDTDRFAYWDNLLITNGQLITEKREAFIRYINLFEKHLFPFTLVYDKSLMSQERLLQYQTAEVGSGMTLVGPQRDDIVIQSMHPVSREFEDVKYFCSRGQQRLVTLELKNAQISYLQEQLQVQPLLVLDDIFSELDSAHISYVLQMTHDYQTIITTTHKEFLAADMGKVNAVIELGERLKNED